MDWPADFKRTVQLMSVNEVAHEMLNDNLDATAAGSVTVAASENSVTDSMEGPGLFPAVDSETQLSFDFNRENPC